MTNFVTVNANGYVTTFANTGDVSFPGNISATNLNGNGSGITSVAGANVIGAVAFATVANSVAGANVSGTVANANYAAFAGNVTIASQPNITAVGTLGNLIVSGNVTVGDTLKTVGVTSNGGLALTSNGAPIYLYAGTVVDATGKRIINLDEPVASSDAATKGYVDALAEGLHVHPSCNVATTTTLATISGGTVTYNNGTAGVGANLVTTGTYNTIDGVTIVNGFRVLVKNEGNPAHNGIYVLINSTTLVRSSDFDTAAEIAGGDFVFVTGGTLYNSSGWVQTDEVTTIGTDPIEWQQFSGAGTYAAGTGLTLTGTTFSISNTTVTTNSYGNSDRVATFTVNSQGQLTAASNVVMTPNAANLTGTTLAPTVLTSSLTTVGTLTSLAVSGTSNLNSVSNVTITGGSNGARLSTNGSGVLSWQAPKKYVREWHIDPANGVDDATAGSYDRPFLTLTFALTYVGNTGEILYLHAGTYTEAVTWSKLNADVVGLSAGGGIINLTGNWDITSVSSSTRFFGLSFANFTHSGAGALYLKNCRVNGTFSKTSGAYCQLTDTIAQGSGVSITGSGQTVIQGGFQQLVTINNSGAQVTISNSDSLAVTTLTAGTLLVIDSSIIAASATANAITQSAGSLVYIYSSRIIGGSATGRLSLAGFYSIINTPVDRANSTITGTNLNTTSFSDSITTFGNLTVGAVANLGAVGNVRITGGSAGQYLQTNGAGGLSFASLSSSSISNGTSNVTIPGASGNVDMNVNGALRTRITDVGANVFGTANITGAISAGSNLTVAGVSTLGDVGNVKITGGTVNQVLRTDGTGNLSWISVSTSGLSNGTSNISIPVSNGNIIAVSNGNTVLTITGTGANINGSLSANTVTATTLTGTLTTNAQPNITSVGTLTSLTVSGTTNLNNVSNITITGGNTNQVLSTNGSGVLQFRPIVLVVETRTGNANISL